MVFSSTLFLLYFLPVFLAAYLLTPVRHRNWTALIASIGFYAWGAPAFVFVVILALLADFIIVKRMVGQEGGARRRWLWTSVVLNVGMLGYFKYSNFLVDNFNALLHPFGIAPMPWAEVVLPIGISFYTFQKLSYTVDVYRGGERPLQRFRDYVLYIMLFPQLIAGPIVRYSEIADRLTDRQQYETVDNRLLGFFRFCVGLARKVWVANVLGSVADSVFALPVSDLSFSLAWEGIIAYSFQIYFDFSGYSDMAIGLGQMMGFRFPENFNNPYAATSITDFWRRWHITLSNWMRDYLYIPLGGNRLGNARLYANLWAVFLISGLWHGAAWTFVLWGAYHGLFLVADRLFLVQLLKKVGRVPATLITYVIVLFGWVLFRADDIPYAFGFMWQMLNFWQEFQLSYFTKEFLVILALAISVCAIGGFPRMQGWMERFLLRESVSFRGAAFLVLISAFLLVSCAASIVAAGFNPFIYFRF
jgi:alginate O-acetyltransferase complex protein AlgI